MSKGKICFLQGNEACAEGAIAAGVNFFAGYPITPATEVAEVLSRRIPQTKGRFIQMEDELACMGAVVGASLAGAKAMTATSGPGYTLLQENIGYAVMTETPCVIVAVMRGGPSTGLPTLSSQSDVMMARWGTHGDHPAIVYCPNSVSESFHLMIRCFNMSEKYRMPVVLLTDSIIGHMRERVEIPDASELEIYNRVKPAPGTVGFKPYDAANAPVKGVPLMANLGDGFRYYITGCVHDESGSPKMGSHAVARNLLARLHAKIEDNRGDIVMAESFYTEDADVMVLAYGSIARPAHEAVLTARGKGKKVSFFRPISLWPSPDKEVLKAAEKVRTIIVPEMNAGQYAGEVCRILGEAGKAVKVVKLMELGSEFIHPDRIYTTIMEEW